MFKNVESKCCALATIAHELYSNLYLALGLIDSVGSYCVTDQSALPKTLLRVSRSSSAAATRPPAKEVFKSQAQAPESVKIILNLDKNTIIPFISRKMLVPG